MTKAKYMNNHFHAVCLTLIVLWGGMLCCGAPRLALAQQTATANVSGYVLDAETKEPLISATASIKDAKLGGFTNKSGFFTVRSIPAGRHTLLISLLGYAKKEISLDLSAGESKKITVELSKKISKGQEVTVEASREAERRQINISQVSVPMQQVKQLRIGGEADVFRTLQFLPGVLTSSQISSGLFIRGGSPDQNLVLLDGMAVYNPSHLFGFISAFNTEAIKDVDLVKGGFPAQYGGRLSAVLSLTQKEGNREKFEGTGAIGLLSSKISLEGPLGAGSWFVGGRASYLTLLRQLIPEDPANPLPNFGFYDLNGKITQSLSSDDKISLSGFMSSDFLGLDGGGLNVNIGIGNRAASLRWTHLFGDNLFSTVVLSSSNYRNGFDGNNGGFEFSVGNTITDYTGKADVEWFTTNDLTLKAGVEISNFRFNFKQNLGSRSTSSSGSGGTSAPSISDTQTDLNINDWTYAAYAQANYNFDDALSMQAGLRWNYQQTSRFALWDPRLSLRYHLNDTWTLKASWGVYSQYLRLASNPDFTFFDTWLPTDSSLGPARSTYYGLSLETKLFQDGDVPLELTVDVYYKSLQNINELNTLAARSRKVSEVFFSGKGEAYGAELFVQKRVGAWTGWVGYALGWVWGQFDSINAGRRFNPRYDRRHDFKVIGLYTINEQWEIGASFAFQSGQPFTGVSSRFATRFPDEKFGTNISVSTDRFGLRLPPSHQLNVNVNYNTTLFGLPAKLLIDIYNVYSRRDIWFVVYNNRGPVTEVTEVRLLPIIPTVSLELKF
jgi:outer membrane receptor protein involved in Fe transport